MKIVILTFHYANNYGALLQCYALSEVLKLKGHTVNLLNLNKPPKKTSLRNRIRFAIYHYRLNKFRKEYLPKPTRKYINYSELKADLPVADCFIVGSDQVWNPQITGDNCLEYFFSFLQDSQKRIAYAASFGLSSWTSTQFDDDIKTFLGKFDSVGIREDSGVEIAKEIFGIRSKQVLDPTLLLDNYDNLTGPTTTKSSLITYKFAKDDDWFSFVRAVSVQLNLDPIALNENKPQKDVKISPFTSVEEWVRKIREASFVITDSFHCMVFAIIFNKPFVVLPAHPERIGRMLSLLKSLNLSDRFFYQKEDILSSNILSTDIDYNITNKLLKEMRKSSYEFLDECLINNKA
ncbi:polysaccharide pyruvyl transferase family protein [Dyadobacter tibetensis]|uniref:polysaccharide pyruvyl transferase family protein n=1 Tax=Dyadobacter tibetensis TaxID=1211851 RepID=UPI00046EEBBE|nr:polysaccharide pyruvyl transferase family protein [Dyadobacter tibetensis]